MKPRDTIAIQCLMEAMDDYQDARADYLKSTYLGKMPEAAAKLEDRLNDFIDKRIANNKSGD